MRAGVTYIREDKLRPYLDAVRRVGLEPVPISPEESRTLKGLSGVVLTGGGDVDPALYDEPADDRTDHVSRKRDDLELALIQEAYALDLPVLGICRGLQVLNVVRGGTLRQHVDGHKDVEHTVRPVPESVLAACIGPDEYMVNSRHHQAIARVAPGLVVTATATGDGVVEAVEDPERRFVMAVQWHPEDRVDTEVRDLRIFRAFAAAIKR